MGVGLILQVFPSRLVRVEYAPTYCSLHAGMVSTLTALITSRTLVRDLFITLYYH
jgi:hypothetical protein